MTNLYSIRDRLIDYYMAPFIGENDKAVLAAVAAVINDRTKQDALQTNPHHFEVWKLATITETGHVEKDLDLIATCDSLVRGGLRKEPAAAVALPGQAHGPTRENGEHLDNGGEQAGARKHPPQDAAPAEMRTAENSRLPPQGAHS